MNMQTPVPWSGAPLALRRAATQASASLPSDVMILNVFILPSTSKIIPLLMRLPFCCLHQTGYNFFPSLLTNFLALGGGLAGLAAGFEVAGVF
jgi:hypothetical protein